MTKAAMMAASKRTAAATIHHRTSDIRALVNVLDVMHGATVNAHPYRQVGPGTERFANLHRAFYRSVGRTRKDQCHAVTRRQPHQLSSRFGFAYRFGVAHDM